MIPINESMPDRVLRLTLALVLVGVAVWAGWPTWAVVFALLAGVVLAVTAAAGWCPLYAALGVSSLRWRRRGSPRT